MPRRKTKQSKKKQKTQRNTKCYPNCHNISWEGSQINPKYITCKYCKKMVKISQYDPVWTLCICCTRFFGLKKISPLIIHQSNLNHPSQDKHSLLTNKFGMTDDIATKIVYFNDPFCCCVNDEERNFVIEDLLGKYDRESIIGFKQVHCDIYKHKVVGTINNGYFTSDEGWRLKIPTGSKLLDYQTAAVSISLLWNHCLFYKFSNQWTPNKI